MQDGVKNLVARLAHHHELVSRAYYDGEIIKTEETAKGVELLHQHKVLIPRGGDTYTLHASLRRFLDMALNNERLYGINADLGSSFERLDHLTSALFDAVHEGNIEDREKLEDEIQHSIYEISDGIAADLAHLRTLVENRFGNVSTLAEKKRQNAYYIGRVEKLVRAIEMFALSDLGERVQSEAAFVNIAAMFRDQLQARLPGFRQNLNGILEILRQYLFEYRKIEERTRLVRVMRLFFERHPHYQMQDWDEADRPPTWLTKAAEVAVAAHPWVRSPEYTDEVAKIALDLEPPATRLATTRPHGAITDDAPVPTLLLQAKPHQKAVRALIAACQTQQRHMSAMEWYASHPEYFGSVEAAVWLQYVLVYVSPQKQKSTGISVATKDLPDTTFSGNIVVNDVIVRPASWTNA